MQGCGAIEKDFNFWLPLEVVKSAKGEMRIGGIATDEEGLDLQGEKVFVDGLDISYMLQRGAFNWDHGKAPGDILGEIDIAQKQGTKLYVEGFLYPTVAKAVETFDLMRSMKESGSKRKLGLSIEGKVKERDVNSEKFIKKAWVKNVAITYNPINQSAFVDMIKSLGKFTFESCSNDCSKCAQCAEKSVSSEGGDEQPFSKLAEGVIIETSAVVTEKSLDSKSKDGNLVTQSVTACYTENGLPSEETVKKADAGMQAGYAVKPGATGGESGAVLKKESLEKDKKVTTFTKENLENKKKRKGTFTKSELTEYLHEELNYPVGTAFLMSDLIFKAVSVTGYMRTRRGRLERVKPFRRELSHEANRMDTMSERALMTRSTKISHPDKMLHFFAEAKSRGMNDLAAVIRHEGKKRLGLKDNDFDDVRKEVKWAA